MVVILNPPVSFSYSPFFNFQHPFGPRPILFRSIKELRAHLFFIYNRQNAASVTPGNVPLYLAVDLEKSFLAIFVQPGPSLPRFCASSRLSP